MEIDTADDCFAAALADPADPQGFYVQGRCRRFLGRCRGGHRGDVHRVAPRLERRSKSQSPVSVIAVAVMMIIALGASRATGLVNSRVPSEIIRPQSGVPGRT